MVLRFRPLSPLNAVLATSWEKGPLGAINLLSKKHSQKKSYTYFIFGTHSVSNEK